MSSHRAERPARGLRRGPLAVLCVAAALASVLLIVAFLLLFATNSLQAWALRHARRS